MLNGREVVIVDPQPVVVRPANPQLSLDTTKLSGGDEIQHGAEQRPDAGEGSAEIAANRCSSKAIVARTDIGTT
jgi:hypothetical protein